MTVIATWNIQYGKGCDGAIDLGRIARVVKGIGKVDVICMQEVSRCDPDIAGGADQAAELTALFPEYEMLFAPGISRSNAGSKQQKQFGNLLFSRLPVLQVFQFLLPRPAQSGIRHMQRVAL